MNIIVEGMDATGKTTLVRYLHQRLKMNVQYGEGPPESIDEINQRTQRYLRMSDTVFDRHPAISNTIYDAPRSSKMPVEPALINEFYESDPFLIYCDPGGRPTLHRHERKSHDSHEHMGMLLANHMEILAAYRMWAVQHAHFIYRIGDDMTRIVRIVESFQPRSISHETF